MQLALQHCCKTSLLSDIARFSTHVRTCLATSEVAEFVFVGNNTRSLAIQLVLLQCCKSILHVFVDRFTVAYGRCANSDSISFLHLPLLQVCLFSWRTKPPRICCLELAERSCRNFPEDERGSGVQKIDWMHQKRLQK